MHARDLMYEEIGRRYLATAMQRVKTSNSNNIVDSFLTKRILDTDISNIGTRFPPSSYVISEWFSNVSGIRQLPFKMMLQTLNITNKDIKDLVMKVKRKKLDMIFSGFGGTGVNTWYWLGKILDHTGDVKLFNSIYVYDDDKVEFSNLLRFPKDFSSSSEIYKANLFINTNYMADKSYKIVSKFDEKAAGDTFGREHLAEDDDGIDTGKPLIPDNAFVYGAPDLESREEFNRMGVKFISATHGNNSCTLMLKPEIDTNIQTEGYGTIDLNTFFFNQLAMTIGFLEFLVVDDLIPNPNYDKDSSEPQELTVHKWEQDGDIFKFSFSDFIKDNKNGRADRQLTFNIDGNRST